MKLPVSRIRTRRTKSREKNAKGASRESRLMAQPFLRTLMAILLWVATVLLLGLESILQGDITPATLLPIIGSGAFLLVGILATALFLNIARPGMLTKDSRILLLCLISLVAIVPAKAVFFFAVGADLTDPQVAGFLLPFAVAPLLATILLDSVVAIAVGIWVAIALSALAGNSFMLLVTGIIATLVAAQTARRVRTRGKVFRAGLAAGVIQIICVFSVTSLHWQETHLALVLHQAAACLLSGFLSAAIVLLILPLFESLFRITTDITLLELTDLGHPLLQRLALEAPGTYHHSLVVANLAQAAADEIGANSLLTRVCAYFHDIGKLTKPEFFTENIQRQSNPHDELPPSMSKLVITSHVKEGLSLAMLHKLPDPIRDVIREHHGTSLISYFHHKAKAQLNRENDVAGTAQGNGTPFVDDRDFRYQGPKPATPESAIICLADAVEAASRSIEKTTAGHIESLVDDITNTKLLDGQLSICSLTLADLTRIKRSFVFSLTNMLHARIPYPKDENRGKQQPRPAPGPSRAGTEPGSVSDGPRATP